MYTGIIHYQTTVQKIAKQENGNILFVFTVPPKAKKRLQVDDSISIAGVCLTVIAVNEDTFSVEAMPETIRRTTLGELKQGQQANLELSLLATDSLDGHFVMGHVDGVGIVKQLQQDGGSLRVTIQAPKELMPYIAKKGSIAVNGVSLTITDVQEEQFGVALIPHTLSKTDLGELQEGSKVNLEVDMIARMVGRFLEQKDI